MQRMNLIQLLMAVSQSDVSAMGQILRSLSTPFVDNVDDRAFYHEFERRMGRYVYGGAAISFGQAVNVSFDLLREHGLRLDPSLTLAVKALMQGEAITAALHPGSGLTVEGVQIIKDMLVQSVTADKVVDVAEQLPWRLARWPDVCHRSRRRRQSGWINTRRGALRSSSIRRIWPRRWAVSRAGAGRSSSRSFWWGLSSVQPSQWVRSWRPGPGTVRADLLQGQLPRVSSGDGGRCDHRSRLVWRWLRGRNTDED